MRLRMHMHSGRSAFSLVEAVVSLIVISGLLVAALNTVGSSQVSQFRSSHAYLGQLLAEALLAEIGSQAYADPNGDPVFGHEDGEDARSRADFDDIDDYHKWVSTPPTEKDGTPLSGWTDWQRIVTVVWIDPQDAYRAVGSETQAKQVTVSVSFRGKPVASLVMLKTDSGLGGL